MYNNGSELLALCNDQNMSIWEAAVLDEMEQAEAMRGQVLDRMTTALRVMIRSADDPGEAKTMGGLIGGEYRKVKAYKEKGRTLSGETANRAMMRALACSQNNAAMGRICAAPTAGSCGILPAALLTGAEELGLGEEGMLQGAFTAAAVGKIIVQNATVAGAEGGCQAECGSAAAMAAAALTEMAGGTPEQALHAAAIALKNIMGLVCDPIAGLVESPCSKRNASGVLNALSSADLALAGVESIIPFDEVVEAMYAVGLAMHPDFKETARGGIATTPTGQKLAKTIRG
ncbi:MAG TPA: L-serine ammonia-lyase, iron-sulfur-dependent, subunit alpha [Clostridiales bacterium]|jgi:L-serine dehydratase|nr:L-serine ammonia-lyase, iron-sulfur-dependent, subunit alpha [Clostridiales bacterium]